MIRTGGFQSLLYLRRRQAAIIAIALLVTGSNWDSEFIEISVPLRDGRFYSQREFVAQCNRLLGASRSIATVPPGESELTGADRAALLLAAETGLLQLRIEQDRLLLRIPSPQDDRQRHSQRRKLERLFGTPLPDWPDGQGMHLPKDFDPSARTVLLLHGLESNRHAMQRLSQSLSNAGFQVLDFDYPNDGPLAWSGDRLSLELKQLGASHSELRLAIVAHSMGGLVARHCLEAPGINPACVTDLFTLGTPHHGSRLAVAQEWLELLFQSLPIVGTRSDTWADGLGEAAIDLTPGSRFLTQLNGRGLAPHVKYHVAIGRKGLITAEKSNAVREQLRAALARRGTPSALLDRLLQLADCNELLAGRGDGAVSVDSAHLPGATSTRIFDLNHWEFLSVPAAGHTEIEVARWVVETLNSEQAGGRGR
ncbi:MAG: alpha/beta hydrolase [Planctomycetes bacterium]|nr:alpha/beta hydrolase [Planctomycetota bacterium]